MEVLLRRGAGRVGVTSQRLDPELSSLLAGVPAAALSEPLFEP
jgi:hypothetical protein